MTNLSSFKETHSFGKYLGVPLVGRAPKKSDYAYLIEHMKSKLVAWKGKHLSFASRVTLAKSVIEALSLYPMMATKIPKAVLQDIHKMQRAFIWGDDENGRHVHAVNWDTVTKPKYLGGLGLRRLSTMNDACLLKLGWELKPGSSSLWCGQRKIC